MFEALTRVFGGGGPAPSKIAAAVTAPLAAIDAGLARRAAMYLDDGNEPEVLLELGAHQPRVAELLATSMVGGGYMFHPSNDLEAEWKRMKLTLRSIVAARLEFYGRIEDPLTLARAGRLVAATVAPERTVDGVPTWFTALLNDVGRIAADGNTRGRGEPAMAPDWSSNLLVEALVTDGMPAQEAGPAALLGVFQATSAPRPWCFIPPERLGSTQPMLLDHGPALTPAHATRLSAYGRTALLERVAASQVEAVAVAPVVAALTVDTAKGPRTAALAALVTLPPEVRRVVVVPVLVSAPPSRSGDLLARISREPDGEALLAEAVEKGAKATVALERTRATRKSIGADEPEPELVLPPFPTADDEPAGEQVLAELRSGIAKLVDELRSHPRVGWENSLLTVAQGATDQQLRKIIDVANGAGTESKLLSAVGIWRIESWSPSLATTHLLRLGLASSSGIVAGACFRRVDRSTDLRTVDNAVRRAGVHIDQVGAKGVGDDRIARLASSVGPAGAWPWFAEHLDVLVARLDGDQYEVESALKIVGAFPVVPRDVLLKVASLAAAGSRVVRPLAQKALVDHPAALALAVQGLRDGRTEVRAGSANWIARQRREDGIEPLRAALAVEKRDIARIAMLASLKLLGVDLADELTPDALLAEAKKGLRAAAPASMAWFDLDRIPQCSWADGSPVDPLIPRWWFVLAVKLKDATGAGLFSLYLSRLAPASATELGRLALHSWLAQDTRHHPEEESRALAATQGPADLQTAKADLERAQRARSKNDWWVEHLADVASRPVEWHVQRVYSAHQAEYLASAIGEKGMLAITAGMPGIELADATQAYIRAHGKRRSQVEALVRALYGNGDPAALQLLLSISRRFKQASVQQVAFELVERLADDMGWSADELADRTIPTAGFGEDRLLRLDFGPREILGRIGANLTISLADDTGKSLASLPGPRAGDDPELAAEAKKQLASARKQVKAVVALQTARLYDAMCLGRAWSVEAWRECLLEHPLMALLVSRLVWVESTADGARPFRPTDDGELIGLDDLPVRLAPDARIALAHRVTLGAETAAAWTAHLADYEVDPLFAQFDAVAPAVVEGAVVFDDLRGHLTDTFSLRGAAMKRGYVRGDAIDGPYFSDYVKTFGGDLRAVIEFTGSYLPETRLVCAVEQLSFRGFDGAPIASLPPILVAEAYADYAAVAALGPYDPDYRSKVGV